jgi:dihydroxyacetone kinase-like protein
MSDTVLLREAGPIVPEMAAVIQREQAFLGEIDGAIGDGDHGINMAKGFRLAAAKLANEGEFTLQHGFLVLGDTLLSDIGGSMGPLYGTFFTEMAESLGNAERLDGARFQAMLHAGVAAVIDLGGAKPGDKSLIDVLSPAEHAFAEAQSAGADLAESLGRMRDAATAGLDSTRDMVARIGRASRLGERSRGTLDAGAASCNMLLATLADGLLARLGATPGGTAP